MTKTYAQHIADISASQTAIKRQFGITTILEASHKTELTTDAKRVLEESYRRVREGNTTQPIKQGSHPQKLGEAIINSKSTIPKSWLNYHNMVSGSKQLEQPNKQLKSASVDGVPSSFRNFQRFQAGITAGSPNANTQPKGRVLSASNNLSAGWQNYRRLIDGL